MRKERMINMIQHSHPQTGFYMCWFAVSQHISTFMLWLLCERARLRVDSRASHRLTTVVLVHSPYEKSCLMLRNITPSIYRYMHMYVVAGIYLRVWCSSPAVYTWRRSLWASVAEPQLSNRPLETWTRFILYHQGATEHWESSVVVYNKTV